MLFSYTFVNTLSSMALACIGIDRLIQVIRPFSQPERSLALVKASVAFSWAYSVVFSLPSAYYFMTVEMPVTNKSQCVSRTQWHTYEYQLAGLNATQIETLMRVENAYARAYHVVHNVTIFWVPFAVILVSYSVMMQQICRYLVCTDANLQAGESGVTPDDSRRASRDAASIPSRRGAKYSREVGESG